MKRSQTYYNYHKLVKSLKNEKGKYRPTMDELNLWFDILNATIFGNKLKPFDKLHIGRPHNAHALFLYWPGEKEKGNQLKMNKVYDNKKLFVEILAHEMIHLFQFQYDEPLGHGPSFWVWRDNFNLKGLTLHKVA
jgi:hypothetical protein